MTMRRRQGKGVETRGVALILVLTTIAILTSIGVDFSYGSRVSLRLAENSRDELRAYYLAKSAVNLSRLLLYFQRQIDLTGGAMARQLLPGLQPGQTPGATAQKTGTPGLQAAGAQGTPAASATPTNNLGIRLWEVLPIDSNAMTGLLGGGDVAALKGPELVQPDELIGQRLAQRDGLGFPLRLEAHGLEIVAVDEVTEGLESRGGGGLSLAARLEDGRTGWRLGHDGGCHEQTEDAEPRDDGAHGQVLVTS